MPEWTFPGFVILKPDGSVFAPEVFAKALDAAGALDDATGCGTLAVAQGHVIVPVLVTALSKSS